MMGPSGARRLSRQSVATWIALTAAVCGLVAVGGDEAPPAMAGAMEGASITTRVSVSRAGREGDMSSYAAAISADGRLVVFNSEATDLVAADTNGRRDAFVHDLLTGITRRVSVASDGSQAAPTIDPFGGSTATAISADGRYISMVSVAPNLVRGDTNRLPDVFVH